MASDSAAPFAGLTAYFGDLHNHCDISYGRGSMDEAWQNARLQLDFASVTGHAWWPDMPPRDGRLDYLVDYHVRGFEHLASVWDEVQEKTARAHEDGRFVTFLSFEWHSMRHGDYCFYYDGAHGEIVRAPDIAGLRAAIDAVRADGRRAMMIPHHVCYVPGYRGVNWSDFDARYSPLVEIVSMHGCAEHDDAPRPYLHSMGPRDDRGSMRAGLAAGLRFGVIGSTDHHAAHPGSHDHGRLGVWASELTRDGIWSALEARRTWALTGDRIELAFAVNGEPMGAEIAATPERTVRVDARAGAALDYVEIVKDGVALARRDAVGLAPQSGPHFRGKVALTLGWGERGEPTRWRARLGVRGGRLLGVEPRLRGEEAPESRFGFDGSFHAASVSTEGDDVVLDTRTWKNPTTRSDATQAVAIELEGDGHTRLVAEVNGQRLELSLAELRDGPRAVLSDGFVSPAWQLSRAIPEAEYAWSFEIEDTDPGRASSYYYARVRQKNDQWAWSSPVFVGPGRSARGSDPAASGREAFAS